MISLKNVDLIYPNGTVALRDVSFEITDGEFVFVIGESGAGKSSIIKLLTREERVSAGEIELYGVDLGALKAREIPQLRRRIGMIFQNFRLIPSRTVAENVAFAMEIIGANTKDIKRRVQLVLSVVGLRDKADVYPEQLSGGEAQRVGIARALVNNPNLILADEPTGDLDPVNSEAIMALLERINRNGTTIIACTHDLALVDKMRKRVIEISDGAVARDGRSGNLAAECGGRGRGKYKYQFGAYDLGSVECQAEQEERREDPVAVAVSEQALRELKREPVESDLSELSSFEQGKQSSESMGRKRKHVDYSEDWKEDLENDSAQRKIRRPLAERTEEMKRILQSMNERAKRRSSSQKQAVEEQAQDISAVVADDFAPDSETIAVEGGEDEV